MRQKSGSGKAPAEQVIEDIRRATRKQYSPEEKIRILLEDLPSLRIDRTLGTYKSRRSLT